ncbi:pyruvate ferredoxin oxidoreductase, partial [Patescibacteria group bacterium]|nr:pyruvate ferredoxin oxidoreductase [Patescibacteria group bacterium]
KTIKIARLAVETNLWPLYEVENGKYKINYSPSSPLPVIEWIKSQGRFKHLLLPENQSVVQKIQEEVDKEWQKLKDKVEMTNK